MDDFQKYLTPTDSVKKAAKIIVVLLIVVGGGLKLLASSVGPEATATEFRDLAALPPHHSPVFGHANISVGDFVEIAAHHAEVDGDEITWRSTLLLRSDREDPAKPLELAQPMAAGTSLLGSTPAGASLVRGPQDRVVAIAPPADAADRLELSIRQAPDTAPGLQAPILARHVAQRVTSDGAYYYSGEQTPLSYWLVYRATRDISRHQIDWIDQQIGEPPSHDGTAIYLRGHPAFYRAGGFSGQFVDPMRVWAKRAAILLAVVGALALVVIARRRRGD